MNVISKTFQPGSIAIVTGGGNGLGRQLCLQLAKLGIQVQVADIDNEGAMQTVSFITENGGKAQAHIFDVSNPKACETCVEEIVNTYGKIDLLISNAGKVAIGEFNDVPLESWHNIMDTNFFGQLNIINAVYTHMRQNQKGRIVIMSSVAGLVFQPLTGSYNASKHALVGLACSLFSDAAPHGIKVHLVCPGYIDNTNIFVNAESFRYSSLKIRDILVNKIRGFISPEKATRKILHQIHKNKFFIVFPFNARLLWLLFRLMPETTVRFSYMLKDKMLSAKMNQTLK